MIIRPTGAICMGVAALVAGCGSSGDDSTAEGGIQGLEAPSQLSIVTADGAAAGLGAPADRGGDGTADLTAAAQAFGSDTDYVMDMARVWVWDPAMEPLETVNEILCKVAHTRYSALVNQGPYSTQTNRALCEKGDDESPVSGDTGQSSNNGVDYETILVDSRRTSRTTPHEVRFWVETDDESFPDHRVYAQMIITRGAGSNDPFGQFTLNYASIPSGGDIENPVLRGSIRALDPSGDRAGFDYYAQVGDVNVPAMNPDDFATLIQAAVVMDKTGETGVARVRQSYRFHDGIGDSGLQVREWRVAFDPTHLKRREGMGPEVTLARGDYRTTAWNYNLYHASGDNAGAQVELNSGFPFRNADGQWGFAGYFGLFTPDEVELDHGDTVFSEVDEALVEYEVVQAPGRLIKYERQVVLLADVEGETYFWHDGTDTFRVEVMSGSFVKTEIFNPATESFDAITPDTIDVSAEGGALVMFSEGIGGIVTYLDGAADVTFYVESFVTGADELFDPVTGEATLYGYFDCLRSEITGAEAESGNIFLAPQNDVMMPYVFRIDEDDLTLRYDADGMGTTLTDVGLATGEVPSDGPNLWGMRSGAMVADTAGLVDVHDIFSQPAFYVYETGHNPWNRYSALRDSMGDYVEFDRPLQFFYEHSVASDVNGDATFDGREFLLQYGGPGNLWGIPGEAVDLSGDGDADRWYPVFSLTDCVLMGPNGDEYVVRGIDFEETLNTDPAGAPGLDLTAADALILPDGSAYATPTIGPPPVVTDPPAVIDGKLTGLGTGSVQ